MNEMPTISNLRLTPAEIKKIKKILTALYWMQTVIWSIL